MNENQEQIQVFYEIAMSIGKSLDLKTMLRQTLTVFLKKLNCTAGGVFLSRPNGSSIVLKDSFILPRSYTRSSAFSTISGMIEELMVSRKNPTVEKKMPIQLSQESAHILIMELPGSGYIFFVRNSEPFREVLINFMRDPVSRLAGACIACYQNQELIKARTDLELIVSKRTKQLELSNAELKTAYSVLKKTQKQLIHNEKMVSIGHLAAGVAHEINNPTAYITSNLHTLEDYFNIFEKLFYEMEQLSAAVNKTENESVSAILQNIDKFKDKEDFSFILKDSGQLIRESLQGAERIKNIVEGLQGFARTDSTDNAQADINSAIENALKLTGNELKHKCKLKKSLTNLPVISCASDQLTQVFVNILLNAAQAIEDFGMISVETFTEDGSAAARICDNGMGISKENMENLFDPFFTTKDVGKGTGLGLSISLGIIEKHGGTIEVESSPGEGTCFIIRFPI